VPLVNPHDPLRSRLRGRKSKRKRETASDSSSYLV
jgi:hypothetical protein